MKRKPPSLALASDHAGLEMKQRLRNAMEEWGYAVEDLGPLADDPVDYPDYAEAVAARVSGGQAKAGVLVCGTGVGMSIAANKFPGVRAAPATPVFTTTPTSRSSARAR
jgi:ribose 5-phosphate isomerase B